VDFNESLIIRVLCTRTLKLGYAKLSIGVRVPVCTQERGYAKLSIATNAQQRVRLFQRTPINRGFTCTLIRGYARLATVNFQQGVRRCQRTPIFGGSYTCTQERGYKRLSRGGSVISMNPYFVLRRIRVPVH
ncbi:unnamed protein product, partial [Laminaria digitata]